jgi:extradiol dioxygenase family protein
MAVNPFHLAIPVRDLEATRAFYRDTLGCSEGRSATSWVDLNLFGHQLVLHQVPVETASEPETNPIDGHDVPVPHFGVVLDWEDWHALAERLTTAGTAFVIEPYIRFKGEVGEQATMFFLDPSGNALEFKSFKDIEQLFAS